MVPHHFFYQLALFARIWLFVMLHLSWPRQSAPPTPAPATPLKPKRKRSTESRPFADLTQKLPCAWCDQETGKTAPVPPPRPDPMPPTNRRPEVHDPTIPKPIFSIPTSWCTAMPAATGCATCKSGTPTFPRTHLSRDEGPRQRVSPATTPASRKAAMLASSNANSDNTSQVCSPMRGAGRR